MIPKRKTLYNENLYICYAMMIMIFKLELVDQPVLVPAAMYAKRMDENAT